ncbi:MAG: hypothetical protein H8Z69_05415 [Nanohaloarchaea archaeon]|nr:hypothetical protein [Candidatus Nanohaloarchaea archaeon]
MEFECKNCGSKVERQILGLSHAIRGCGMMLEREMNCCSSPTYIDEKGILKHGGTHSTRLFSKLKRRF